MLANTALVKLSWLLGNYSKEEAKELIQENLRGVTNLCSPNTETHKTLS